MSKLTMKIRVDQDRCQGHNRCKAIAPKLFELDDFGNAKEVGDGRVPSDMQEKAALARANCPEAAIEIVEE